MRNIYFDYRKQMYASINGRIGTLSILSKSKLLKTDELEQLNVVIDQLKVLSKKIKSNGC